MATPAPSALGGHWRHPVAESGMAAPGSLSQSLDFPPQILGMRCGRVEGHAQLLRPLSRHFQQHGEETTLIWKLRALCAHTCPLTEVLMLLLKLWAEQILCLAVVCLAAWYLPERNDEPAYLRAACFSVCLPLWVLCCARTVVGARLAGL